MCRTIIETIMETGPGVSFDDIIGLGQVKQSLSENIIYPQMRPDLFQGLRAPSRGILL